MDCVSNIIAKEGTRALFISFPLTLAMNIPYGGALVATNESLKKQLNPDGKYNFLAFLFCGTIAGGVAGMITTPLDVIKTRLQTQNFKTPIFSSPSPPPPSHHQSSETLRGFSSIVRQIFRETGYRGFVRGILPRILLHAPAAAISWTTYETIKSLFVK